MAKIPRYHQELAAPHISNPGVDSSALQVGNNLIQNTSALANSVNAAQANFQRNTQEVLGAALGMAVAAHQASIKQAQLQHETQVSAASAQLGLAQNDLVQASIKVQPDTLDAGNKFYRENFESAMNSKLDELKITDKGVRAAALDRARSRMATDDRTILSDRQTNLNGIAEASTNNAAVGITKQMSTFQGTDEKLGTLSNGLKAFDELRPALVNSSNSPQAADEKLNKLKSNAAMEYAHRFIDQDPQTFGAILRSGVLFQKPFKLSDGTEVPVLTGDQLGQIKTRLDQKNNALAEQQKVNFDAQTNAGKAGVNTIYARATQPNISPVEKDAAEADLDKIIQEQTDLPENQRNEHVLNFALERRDQLSMRKTESEKQAAAQRQSDALQRTLTNQQRADKSYEESQAKKEAAAKEAARLGAPENVAKVVDAQTAYATAYGTEKNVDLGTKIRQISHAMTLNDNAHNEKLITDNVWAAKTAALQFRQNQVMGAAPKPPEGIQGFLRQNFGTPEEHYYDAIYHGLPDDFLKAKGIYGDNLQTSKFNSDYSRHLVDSVEDYKRKHDGKLPIQGELNDISAQIIDYLKSKPVAQ